MVRYAECGDIVNIADIAEIAESENIGQKFNIPFGYHLLTVSLTVDKQTIILVKEILTI